MPVYEYHCASCGEDFTHVETMREHEGAHPQCPKCGSTQVEQRLSAFFAKTSRKS
ncbi:MAG: zinc ribbon domain-containing protein [Gemmatimonadetes bacterium]|nr:zinc ribbon domain-containing protein [Gemmatimonadota bacterium]